MSKDLIKAGKGLTSIQLVVEKDNTLVANIDVVKSYVSELELEAEEKKKNELDLGNLIEYYSNIKEVWKNFRTYRKGGLSSIASIPKVYTEIENKDWKNIIDGLANEIEKRKEKEYVLADANIKTILDELIEAETEKVKSLIDVRVFHQETSKMRTNSYAQLTGKGTIKKGLKDKVVAMFEKEAQPIRERVALEELKETETKRFDADINSLKINSNDVEVLKEILLDLSKKSEQIKDLYPNTVYYCTNRLRNTYSQVQSNIKALENEAKRIEAEAKAKAEREVDLPLVEELEVIEKDIEVNAKNDVWLNEKLNRAKAIYQEFKFVENRDLAKNIGDRINTKIKLNKLTIEPTIEDLTTPFDNEVEEVEVKIEPTKPTQRVYTLKDPDAVMMDIQFMGITAESETEAIEKMVEVFRKSLIENGVK